MSDKLLDFGGAVAIVTGAGRGLGRAHAVMLASRGCRVVVNDLAGDDDPAGEVVAEIVAAGGTATADHHSVIDEPAGIVDTARQQFGQLDIVVNNAGVLEGSTLADTDPELWHRVFDIHFRGTVDVCRAAWPHLVSSGHGRIINTSSSGMLGNSGLTSYGAAKAAVFGFTRSLAIEGLPLGIGVNCILPSARTRITDMIEDADVAATLKAHFQPEHVAAFVAWLAHPDTRVTNGAFRVSAGSAARVVMTTLPATRPEESTPEAWARSADELLSAPGELTPVLTTAELFGRELVEVNPDLRLAMSEAVGGIPLRTVER